MTAAVLAAALLTLVSKSADLVNIPLAVAALMVIYHVPGLSPSAHLKLNGTVPLSQAQIAKIEG